MHSIFIFSMTTNIPPPSPKAEVRFLSAPASRVAKIAKSVLLITLVLITTFVAWKIVAAPWLERRSWEQGGSPLPDCESPYVAQELIRQYGSFVTALAFVLPDHWFLSIRRAKRNDQPNEPDVVVCQAEYDSMIGPGPITYSITWFDAKNPSFDRLKVTVTEIGGPELITRMLHKIAN